MGGQEDVVKLLLAKGGADVNQSRPFNAAITLPHGLRIDPEEYTAEMKTQVNTRNRIADLILNHDQFNPQPAWSEDGITPLTAAIENSRLVRKTLSPSCESTLLYSNGSIMFT